MALPENNLNPWIAVPSLPPYWLCCDSEKIRAYNAKHANECHRIQDKVLPEPFIGNKYAPVVLLNLNPGFGHLDNEEHARTEFQALIRNNYSQEETDYPFYHLNPAFDGGGRRWWEEKLKPLVDLCGRERVAAKLLCIEYFPYHSWEFNHAGLRLESQTFGFDLARSAIDRGAVIVIMRAEKRWRKEIPGLSSCRRVFVLNSPQNVVLSRRNFPGSGEGFDLVRSTICDGNRDLTPSSPTPSRST